MLNLEKRSGYNAQEEKQYKGLASGNPTITSQ